MAAHQWPGSVRELKNAVERLAITSRDGTAGSFAPGLHFDSERLLATFQALGISRRALYERMKKYGLDRQSF